MFLASNKLALYVFIFCYFFAFDLTAQYMLSDGIKGTSKLPGSNSKTMYEPIDLIDVVRIIEHKGARKFTIESKSEKLHVSVLPAVGYTLVTGFAGVISSNIAFYNGDSSNQKISSVFVSLAYTQHNQIIFPLLMNIWTKGNKYNFVTDCRYMQYPSTNYDLQGYKLGGINQLQNGYTLDYSYFKLHQTVYKTVRNNLYAGMGYYLDYFWNIKELDLPAGFQSGFQKYGLDKTEVSSGVALKLLYDSRLNQINPFNGTFVNLEFRPSFTFMGSQSNWRSLTMEYRRYIKIPNVDHILAFWSYNWFVVGGVPPYLLLPSTGWDDGFNTGRGYIQGRFKGRNMVYLEAEYRFRITHNDFLGGVVFANAETFSSNINTTLGNIYPGWGGGLRFKLNKFSRANLCIDYAFGLEGSRGFFVNLGEVF